MTSLPLKRTEYWNWNSPVPGPRGGSTSRAESFTDAEDYLLPLGQVRASALHLPGVAEGLAVTAVTGQQNLTVAPGVAVDAAGHLIALAAGGFAILDANVDPDDPRNIATVAVPQGDAGVVVPTDNLTGGLVLTLAWREVLGDTPGVSERVHAPWLRLLDPAAPGLAELIVLARVNLDAAGAVTALSAEGRRLVGVPAERVELRRPTGPAGAPRVDQAPAGELRARADGSLELNRLIGNVTRPVLVVDARGNVAVSAAGGDVTINPSNGSVTIRPEGGDVRIVPPDGGVTVRPEGGDVTIAPPNGGVTIAPEGAGVTISPPGGTVTIAPQGGIELAPAGGDVRVPPGTQVGVGVPGRPQRPLHVEGAEVHSGGSGGGFSFADRGAAFTESPTNGERWVWYASGGAAHLWSGKDRVSVSPTDEGGGLDVGRRMRVRQGGDSSAGIWFNQDGVGDRAFVGMAGNDEVGFFGTGVGWTVRTNVTQQVTTVDGRLNVNGQSCAVSFCNLSDGRLKTDVAVLDDPLERLERLRGVSFRWDPASGAEGPGIGVLAQEVAREFPELVSEIDAERLGVDYAGLTAVLVEAVKALSAQHETMRRQNALLEHRLERLERRLPPDED